VDMQFSAKMPDPRTHARQPRAMRETVGICTQKPHAIVDHLERYASVLIREAYRDSISFRVTVNVDNRLLNRPE